MTLRHDPILTFKVGDTTKFLPISHGNQLTRKELKICEAKADETSIDEPSEVELKDLPPHLEYAFLEGDNKLPVIIAKDLSVREKAARQKSVGSPKAEPRLKLSDIKVLTQNYTQQNSIEEDIHTSSTSETPALNWEKSHFMVKEGIVLGHKISKSEIEVDRAKIDVIAKLPHPTTVKGSVFSGHADFIEDSPRNFFKIPSHDPFARKSDVSFISPKSEIKAFTLSKKEAKTEAPILMPRLE
ncbi:hypothetical protein Tco_1554018 [Tanacetum coccineum]